jgi:hypothetical protein
MSAVLSPPFPGPCTQFFVLNSLSSSCGSLNVSANRSECALLGTSLLGSVQWLFQLASLKHYVNPQLDSQSVNTYDRFDTGDNIGTS